jgi:hypothetical protein
MCVPSQPTARMLVAVSRRCLPPASINLRLPPFWDSPRQRGQERTPGRVLVITRSLVLDIETRQYFNLVVSLKVFPFEIRSATITYHNILGLGLGQQPGSPFRGNGTPSHSGFEVIWPSASPQIDRIHQDVGLSPSLRSGPGPASSPHIGVGTYPVASSPLTHSSTPGGGIGMSLPGFLPTNSPSMGIGDLTNPPPVPSDLDTSVANGSGSGGVGVGGRGRGGKRGRGRKR